MVSLAPEGCNGNCEFDFGCSSDSVCVCLVAISLCGTLILNSSISYLHGASRDWMATKLIRVNPRIPQPIERMKIQRANAVTEQTDLDLFWLLPCRGDDGNLVMFLCGVIP